MKGWSQEKLAEHMNLSPNSIHDIETGKKFVRAQRLIEFSSVFNTEIYKLFLPEELSNYDTVKIIAKYNEDAKDALNNLLEDFMNNPTT